MPEFPSWRVMTYSEPADKWDVHLITHHEEEAREQAGHLQFKGIRARLQHRRGKSDDWDDIDFVEAPPE